MFLSFCIITTGDKPEKTNLCIESIHRNFTSFSDDYEIIIVGNNVNKFKDRNVKIIEDNEFIEFLGKRKNIATENSHGDILIHCDDDIIFNLNWVYTFKKYNKQNPNWLILGNKVLLPSGSRYWDRSIYYPQQQMVPYDFNSESVTFYQSGAFSICKRSLLDKISWDDNIPFYADKKGFPFNEDVDFSIKLKKEKIKIHFDKENTVWHYDENYISNDVAVSRTPFFPHVYNEDFKALKNSLEK